MLMCDFSQLWLLAILSRRSEGTWGKHNRQLYTVGILKLSTQCYRIIASRLYSSKWNRLLAVTVNLPVSLLTQQSIHLKEAHTSIQRKMLIKCQYHNLNYFRFYSWENCVPLWGNFFNLFFLAMLTIKSLFKFYVRQGLFFVIVVGWFLEKESLWLELAGLKFRVTLQFRPPDGIPGMCHPGLKKEKPAESAVFFLPGITNEVNAVLRYFLTQTDVTKDYLHLSLGFLSYFFCLISDFIDRFWSFEYLCNFIINSMFINNKF